MALLRSAVQPTVLGQKLSHALDRQHHNVLIVNCHVVLYDLVTEFCQSLLDMLSSKGPQLP
jgi:hypothetical protein